MSVETLGHTGQHPTVETTPEREQPLVTPDATTLEPYEVKNVASQRDILYLSSAAIIAHEHASIAGLVDEAVSLQQEISLVMAELARIAEDFRYVAEQASDLGYMGTPQLRMQTVLKQEQLVILAKKEALEATLLQKNEAITALKAHQERREWSLRGTQDY